MNTGLTLSTVYDFLASDGRITIDFIFKDEILAPPIIRRNKRLVVGHCAYPSKALSANLISNWMKKSGQRAGFEHPFHLYTLRRKVGTELTGELPSGT